MLRWMCGKIRMDKVRNEDIRCLVGVASIGWFGHIGCRSRDALVRRIEKIDIA